LIHWSLGVVALLIAVNLANVVGPDGGVSVLGVVVAVLAAIAFFGSVLAHELSHALTARHYGVGTDSITLWALGGIAALADEPPTARSQGWIALAGPAASFVLGLAGVGLAVGLYQLDVASEVVTVIAWLGIINGLLAVFNLLPGAPLDGGRVVAAVRWGRHGDRYRAMEEAATAGRVVGWLVAGVGIWMMLEGYGGLFIAITGGFIALNATAERAGAQARRRLQGLVVSDLTWYGIARASGQTDADTMLWQRSRLGPPKVVAVEDAEGELVGLVSEEQLWQVPEPRRDDTRLADLAVPMAKFGRARPDEPLTSALNRLTPLHPMLTVWSDGRLVGVVPSEKVAERLRDD
jgi:Zn-dependent protease